MLSSASFLLLVAALGLVIVAIVAAISAPGYTYSMYGKAYSEQMEIRAELQVIRAPHIVVTVAAFTGAGIAMLFAWILGRIAVAPAPDRPALTGWRRERARIAPGIASAALLAFFFGLIPVAAFAVGQEQIFRRYSDPIEIAGGAGLATAVLVVLLAGFGILLHRAPGVIHAVFSPVTDRLRPRHGSAFLIAAAVVLLLGGGVVGIYLFAHFYGTG